MQAIMIRARACDCLSSLRDTQLLNAQYRLIKSNFPTAMLFMLLHALSPWTSLRSCGLTQSPRTAVAWINQCLLYR